MKKISFISMLLIIAIMGCGIMSCNDDDKENDNSTSIVGTWVDYEYFYPSEDGYWFTFRSNGTGTYEEMKKTYDFTYKVKGNELVLSWPKTAQRNQAYDEIYHFVITDGKLYLYATDTGELDFILSRVNGAGKQ